MAETTIKYEDLVKKAENFEKYSDNLRSIIDEYAKHINSIGAEGDVYAGGAAAYSKDALVDIKNRLSNLVVYVNNLAAFAKEAVARNAEADAQAYRG